MRDVDIIGYGGIRYGYVHHPRKDKELTRKLAKLEELGCTDITCDIGVVKNRTSRLEKATFRDHILFYDHAAFQTVDELHDMYEIGLGSVDGSPSFTCDFYDRDTLLDLAHTPEDTARYRRRRLRQRKLESILSCLLAPLSFTGRGRSRR